MTWGHQEALIPLVPWSQRCWRSKPAGQPVLHLHPAALTWNFRLYFKRAAWPRGHGSCFSICGVLFNFALRSTGFPTLAEPVGSLRAGGSKGRRTHMLNWHWHPKAALLGSDTLGREPSLVWASCTARSWLGYRPSDGLWSIRLFKRDYFIIWGQKRLGLVLCVTENKGRVTKKPRHSCLISPRRRRGVFHHPALSPGAHLSLCHPSGGN